MMRWLLSLVGIMWCLPVPSYAQTQGAGALPAPRATDRCAIEARRLNDPFLELDATRCQAAYDYARERIPAVTSAIDAELCAAHAVALKNPQLQTDRLACLKAWSQGMFAESANGGGLYDAASNLAARLVPLSKTQEMHSYCAFLAKKHGQNAILSNPGACNTFAKEQYFVSPAASLAEYRTYCQELIASIPLTISQADAFRICPAISRHIELKQGFKKIEEAVREDQKFSAFLILKSNAILLLALVAVLGLIVGTVMARRRGKRQLLTRLKEQLSARSLAEIALFGATQEEREHRLASNEFLNFNRILSYREDGFSSPGQLITKFSGNGDATLELDPTATKNYYKALEVQFTASRSMATMNIREEALIQIGYLLFNQGLLDAITFDSIRLRVIQSGMANHVDDGSFKHKAEMLPEVRDIESAISAYIKLRGIPSFDTLFNRAVIMLQRYSQTHADNVAVKKLFAVLGQGEVWLTGSDLPTNVFANSQVAENEDVPHLILGSYFEGGKHQYLSSIAEGAVLTIAPPGAGKTQCHVIPNLLNWTDGAMVLDVKGDLFKETSGWRSQRCGPVYRFAPLEPENSHCFNPLTSVRGDRSFILEDSRFLADMLYSKTGGSSGDRFWDERARDLLTAIIADACYGIPPAERSMDHLHNIASRIGWDEFVVDLVNRTDIPAMQQEGSSLMHISEKTLDSVLQTLRVTLQPWAGQRVREITRRSDWTPTDLRAAGKGAATVYICLKPGEIESYASILRVFVGLHLRALMAELPPHGSRPILMMLDEMPQLRYMPPIEEALDTGRQYGIKLWLFAQNEGQLRKVYPNADGMMGSCAVRAYMNPGAQDGLAERLVKQLGERFDVIRGTRVPVMSAVELSGPDFEQSVLVFGVSSKPALLNKIFALNTRNFKEKMGLPLRH